MNNKSNKLSVFTHLTHDDKINILAKIVKGRSLSEISKDLNKSKSTIIREVQNNLYFPIHPQTCSACLKRKDCVLSKGISQRHWICQNFEPELCERQKHFPYVCNGCERRTCCNHAKCYYNCDEAYFNGKENWKHARKNKHVTKHELEEINYIVSRGVRLGQSIHHIYASSKFLQLLVSEITIRRYLYDGLFDVSPANLHRFKRYSKKYDYSNMPRHKIAIAMRENRTFQDFKKFIEFNKLEKEYWEYDSIEGKETSKYSILTLTFAECSFQVGYKIRKHSSTDANVIVRKLQLAFGEEYKDVFKVNLSDNGAEFFKFTELEIDKKTGERICRVFFTNPFKSTDKPHCERSHEYFRYVIPKGTNFDDLSQEEISKIFSNIDSYKRKSLNEKSPYEVFVKRFGKKAAVLLDIEQIDPEDVNLSPSLIKRIKK